MENDAFYEQLHAEVQKGLQKTITSGETPSFLDDMASYCNMRIRLAWLGFVINA